MSEAAQYISFFNLIYILIPVGIVFFIFYKWNLKLSTLLYAHVRMFIQLIAIGYCLTFLFNSDKPFFNIDFIYNGPNRRIYFVKTF